MALILNITFYGLLLITVYCVVNGNRNRNARCEEITVPICKGFLPYNQTQLPNRYGHTDQAEIFSQLDLWSSMMDDPCSNNFRLLACGALLPECGTGYMPCKEACLWTKRNCRNKMRQIGFQFPKQLKCRRFKRRNTHQCTRPRRRLRGEGRREFHFCEENTIDLCNGLPYTRGSLPNLFLQGPEEVATEIENFRELVESGCHEHVRLFVCGVYKPFCPNNNAPQVMPCQDLCNAVNETCFEEYGRLYPGFHWPSKFQCHRFPETSMVGRYCFQGNDENPLWEQQENN